MSVALTPLEQQARRLSRPTLFLPGLPSRDPEEFASLAGLARRLTALGGGRPLTFRKGRAAYPDLADFAALTVKQGDLYLATVGGPWFSAQALDAAADELRGLT